MFYVNNEQVKGIFLNGRNCNYLSYGFGKIIPEDRSAQFAYINLAEKYLNQYRIEFGTVKDGYENALVSPRFDKPDSNGVFHTPFTYYYGGNIIPTKEVNILITNGNYALMNALVYNDMNINGAINYFATNTDFQGHNVNTYLEGFGSSQSYFESIVMSNCSNFHLRSLSRFSKGSQPALYNCNNFSGWFNFVRGDDGTRYPGFRGFLYQCKDGVFNINCKNMHGDGSDANVQNYYNFSGIQSCENMNINITGSSWQVWPHDHSFTRNCNINTYNVISGFSYMNDCNFNIVLPKDSKPEMDKPFEFLNNAENCNYNLNALDSNLFNYRSGVGHTVFFDSLNNCNLNLLVNNTASFDYLFGGNLNNCNIVFDNIKADLATFDGWKHLNNCKITGNVEASSSVQDFIGRSDGLNVNINAAKSSRILFMWRCNNVKGNLVCGDMTYTYYSAYQNLNVSGGRLNLINAEHSRFNFNGTIASFTNVNNTYARVYNTTFSCHNTNNTNIYSGGGNVAILGADNCYNLTLSGLTFNTPDSNSLFENVYNSKLKFGTANPYYHLWRVANCKIDGFPRGFAYVNNCVFRPFNIKQVGLRNSEVGTWYNVWPHRTTAGIRSMDNLSNCRIDASAFINSGDTSGGNNLRTSLGNHYNLIQVTTNNANSRLTVSCNDLRLDLQPVLQQFVIAGFVDSSISTNNIAPLGVIGLYNAGAKVGTNTRIYCSNYCMTPFYSESISYSSQNQPVVLLNDYNVTNGEMYKLSGGLYRFGTLSNTPYLNINNGACVFINNISLSSVNVDNALLFMGSNARVTGTTIVTNGGLIANRENWGPNASKVWDIAARGQLCWSLWDSGPWGGGSLWDYCVWV